MLHEWVAQWSAAGGPPEAVELVERLGALDRAGPRRRVLVVTMDVLAPSMAGPAIRATAIATALAREHDVRLVTTSRCELERPDLDVRGVSDAALEGLVGWADVVILQGWVMVGRPWIASSSCVVVVDAYDPMHLEQLEQGRDAGGTRGRVEAVRGATATLNEQLRRADLVLCASDKQRDLWLGALATLGRVNPVTYDVDPSMGHLIAVVPFGVPDEPFPDGAGALKGVVPGIGVDDHVLLWGGGVYNWFDPLTLVQAVDALRHRVPTVRLYFMGMQHPNPGVAPMQMASDLRRLSDERGLTDVHVFFNAGWVAFEDRAGYLRDADIGVSTHLDHVETAFSFRTRLLDYLWAGLPIVATRGDSFAPLIDERGAGCTVDAQDVAGLEAALEAILLDPSRAADAAAASRRTGRRAHLGAQPAAPPRVLPASWPGARHRLPHVGSRPPRRGDRGRLAAGPPGPARLPPRRWPPGRVASCHRPAAPPLGRAATPLAFAHARADPGRSPRVLAPRPRRSDEGRGSDDDQRCPAGVGTATRCRVWCAPAPRPRARSGSPPWSSGDG